jgi:hypothetical protein
MRGVLLYSTYLESKFWISFNNVILGTDMLLERDSLTNVEEMKDIYVY